MFIEPLQRLEVLQRDLSADSWESDESRRDAVWLSAGELWLRRAFLSGENLTQLTPTPDDVRVAGAAFGCALLLGCFRLGRLEDVFFFTGDLLKWRAEAGDRLGEPAEYLALARRLAAAATQRWPEIGGEIDPVQNENRFARLQALIWSVQTLRVRPASLSDLASPIQDQVDRLVQEIVLDGGNYQLSPMVGV